MIGPYESEEDMLEAILYWQKRALAAEKQVEEECDAYEDMVDTALEFKNARDYYKQQFLDKDRELRFILGDDNMSGDR